MCRSGRGIVRAVWLIVLVGSVTHRGLPQTMSLETDSGENVEEVLKLVSQLTTGSRGTACVSQPFFRFAKAEVPLGKYEAVRQKADLLATILRSLPDLKNRALLELMVTNFLLSDAHIDAARVLVRDTITGAPFSLTSTSRPRSLFHPTDGIPIVNTTTHVNDVQNTPWFEDVYNQTWATWNATKFQKNQSSAVFIGWWTYPYFQCKTKRWIISYTVPLSPQVAGSVTSNRTHKISELGMLSVDVDVTSLDINQCDPKTDTKGRELTAHDSELTFFYGTHKCHNESAKCVFTPGRGWVRGGYKCHCRDGYYAARSNNSFNGSLVEVAWEGKQRHENPAYDMLYVCLKCSEECPNCTSDDPCMAYYNWPFRIALLTISVLCAVLTIVLIALVYHYRSVKVFSLASPTFLCVCLIGCVIMYLEMAAIFPVLDMYSCVATKWTRHLGFCITFSSLLMKTWRVSLTYRVKSAHKIKLTDKQLLQWLTPILMIMVIYLSAWSLSATPTPVVIQDYNNLDFMQCRYDWWDHSLAMGEFLFLMWGVKVCFSVRKAESFFDEATYISWAVYNIAIINIVMVAFHLLIFPNAGPDIKYVLGFLRTQCSTSTTVLLIFGPKFYRIVKGTGDQYDNRARAKGVTASFSLNGLGFMNDEPADMYQENEELKEEIQKLAAQMEFMKIVHMEVNNRHLKPKPGGYFSEKNSIMNTAQSPGGKNTLATNITTAGGKIDGSNENSSARLSPAAELVSERV